MGIESANYHFIPDPSKAEGLRAAVERHQSNKWSVVGKFEQTALTGPRHWIDVQLGMFTALPHQSLAIRLALCNPPESLQVLRGLLSNLLVECGGYVVDKNANARFTEMGEREWTMLQEAFRRKQMEFFRIFGEKHAAISADNVFTIFDQGEK